MIVVTGTDTGVGKTIVSAALARITGARTSSSRRRATTTTPRRRAALRRPTRATLARFPEPLAPASAGSTHDASPDRSTVARRAIVEGAGGLLVRFGDASTIADVAALLDAPVIVVARAGLGTLNHTALTVRGARARGSALPRRRDRLVAGEPDLAEQRNLDDLRVRWRPAARPRPGRRRPPGPRGVRRPSPRLDQPVTDILDIARDQVLERGIGLDEAQVLEVLRLPDERVDDALELAHEVRMKWCGDEVEVEGIVSIKTGGCPEDCHFCSQSGRFETPVRAAKLDIPELVEAARETAATGATEFCIVAAVRGPDERLMAQVRDAVAAIRAAVDINVACSLGILTEEQGDELRRSACTATTTTSRPPARTSARSSPRTRGRSAGRRWSSSASGAWRSAAAASSAWARRSSSAPSSPRSSPRSIPHEVPMNFLDPRPGTPFADIPPVPVADALRTIAAFRLAHAAHDPALRRRPRADAGRPRRPPGHGRRHQRGDRRQLPDDARPRPAGGPRPARRALDAGEGAASRRCDRSATGAAGPPTRATTPAAVRGAPPPTRRASARSAAASSSCRSSRRGYTARCVSAARSRRAARGGPAARAAPVDSAPGPAGRARRPRGAAAVLERLPRAGGRSAGARRRRGGRAALGRRRGLVAAGQRRTGPPRELEAELADYKGTEACLLFGSGFLANLARDHGAHRAGRGRRLRRAQPRLDRRRLPARARGHASSTSTATVPVLDGRRPRSSPTPSSPWTATSRRWTPCARPARA